MDYKVTLNQFEGPLDLLLDLIKKQDLEIYEINLSVITDQYLEYLAKMEEINLNISGDYLVIAAELMNIKSKKLLPNNEAEEAEQEFINQIIDYKNYKEISEKLGVLNQTRLCSYSKPPSQLDFLKIKNEKEEIINEIEFMAAFSDYLNRKLEKQPLQATVCKKEYSIKKRQTEIEKILKQKNKINFFELFEEINKPLIIVTFLTILEMSRKLVIEIIQENNFQEIYLVKKAGAR